MRAPTLIVLAVMAIVAILVGPDVFGAIAGALDGFTVGA